MTTLGKYELHEQLGRGGFGTVYRATDTTLGREVALKILHPQLTTDPDFLERFRNEARLVANLRSPHIVTIHELGEVDGRVFIAMEYLAGGSLKQRLERGPIPYPETVEIMRQVCDGLSVAHAKGLVHRDIKPGNILFDIDGRAVIADFGLARAMQVSSSSASSSMGGVGTPAYRAPELWRGKPPASPATDIYSLGCVLSEMLTGKALFDGDTPDEIITQHLVDGPRLPDTFAADVPAGIWGVLDKALLKVPLQRTANTSAFMQELDEISKNNIFNDMEDTEEPKPLPTHLVNPNNKDVPFPPRVITKPQPAVIPPPLTKSTLSPILTNVNTKKRLLLKAKKQRFPESTAPSKEKRGFFRLTFSIFSGLVFVSLIIIGILNRQFSPKIIKSTTSFVPISSITSMPTPTFTISPTISPTKTPTLLLDASTATFPPTFTLTNSLTPDFSVFFQGLTTCNGDYAITFKLTNVGNISWESIRILVTDKTKNLTREHSSDLFKNYDGCDVSISQDDLLPGESGMVTTVPGYFNYDLKGHELNITVTLYSKNGLYGTSISKTLDLIP